MIIDPKQLAEWKALAEKATEGPWESRVGAVLCQMERENYFSRRTERVPVAGLSCTIGEANQECHNGDFIAAARTAVPALIAEVERLREEAEGMRRAWVRSQNGLALEYGKPKLPLDARPAEHALRPFAEWEGQ